MTKAGPDPGRVEAASDVAIKRQVIVGTRRRYNQWVNNQTLEDYALRFTATKARVWSPMWVANTALGSIAFLACEALGATVTIGYGFESMAWALGVAAAIFLISGIPICYYGARYGVDMDLLTRGSGFGYLGSTITSAVYASFTFILFSIEAVILSAALELSFGIPLPIGHLISAMVVIPIVAYGFRRISQWQNWTQPLWLALQVTPVLFLAAQGPHGLALWTGFHGTEETRPLASFAVALAVFLSLLPQIGEQVDYLRFLPEREKIGRLRWWSALLATGPGWIVIGAVKIALGSFLAVVALSRGMGAADAANPAMLYFMSFGGLVSNGTGAIVLTIVFVALCQIKINVTNAYAGSIASSNFFSRLTHRHPGRVVWLVFNTLIALMLMQGGIQTVVERVLTLYSNFAVAWFGAVIADLMINKPLGLSPPGIEFRRAYLHDLNPVGVGAMALSILCSTLCFAGIFGEVPRMLSPVIGLTVSFTLAPVIARLTGGRYYLARRQDSFAQAECTCKVCENRFEAPDMAVCPVYDGAICSLCCTLEARCHDACKERPQSIESVISVARRYLPSPLTDEVYARVLRFLLAYCVCIGIGGLLLLLIFYQRTVAGDDARALASVLRTVFVGFTAIAGFGAWYFTLSRESQRAAEQETERQTVSLMKEIAAHARTDAELQRAKNAAEAANLAKSRYIIGISHEIRTPLNAISGYAQLLERSNGTPLADAVRVIRRSSTHLADLVDGLVDVSRIENGSVRIARERVNLTELLTQIVDMFRIQAAARGIQFKHGRPGHLPIWIYTDQKRLRQILINLISNAIKYTPAGTAALNVYWRNPVAEFEVQDTGVGIDEAALERIFEPFERIGTVRGQKGVGLGLTITRMLVDVMGGQLTVRSTPGLGSTFTVKMFFSEAPAPEDGLATPSAQSSFAGQRRRLLVVDDDPTHLELTRDLLVPLGFEVEFADNGRTAIETFLRSRPDLVIMDIAMPAMDGWEAARAIRAIDGDSVPILMVSANVHDFQRPRRDDDPHDDCLAKPYDIEVLLDRIGVLLDLDPSHPAGAAE
ncbi:Signal transduction histidine kinase [Novosphingobium sp. CF614]|uniref:hybrid sensor histidine kinase/response regulator n=1 Tax=Novosphingobium sp. CF614 TaxID=1884364 RepID=UPI0008E6E317|nr:ATP-binding protein [Novosphingobium sp. CF614]SFG31021.1 Signal transduction histidine kinase [Novosphingobium sp. CF614]